MDFSLAMKCDGGLEEGELGYNLLRLNKNLTFKNLPFSGISEGGFDRLAGILSDRQATHLELWLLV
jgi:hypothetical protein